LIAAGFEDTDQHRWNVFCC